MMKRMQMHRYGKIQAGPRLSGTKKAFVFKSIEANKQHQSIQSSGEEDFNTVVAG